jgi:hypothetical protein
MLRDFIRHTLVVMTLSLVPADSVRATEETRPSGTLLPQDFAWRYVGHGGWVKLAHINEVLYFLSFFVDGDDEIFEAHCRCPTQFSEPIPPLLITISWRNNDGTATMTGCFDGAWIPNGMFKTYFLDLPSEARRKRTP